MCFHMRFEVAADIMHRGGNHQVAVFYISVMQSVMVREVASYSTSSSVRRTASLKASIRKVSLLTSVSTDALLGADNVRS